MKKIHKFYDRLRNRWGVQTFWQFLLIMLVFALTGFSILYVKDLVFKLLGITKEIPIYWRILISIALIMPIYQVLLLAWGFLFGQFRFFWEFEKRSLKRISGLFSKKRSADKAE